MHAIRVPAPGGAEVLRYEDIPTPEPGLGQILVKVEAAGVNYIDVYLRTGAYAATFPFTLGKEVAGTVAAVGPGVTMFRPGDRVASADAMGGYAEYTLVPADRAVTVPAGVSTRLAAAVFLQGLTAHYLAVSTYPLRSGVTCLVHAAAGGVGLLLCQIARYRGARVIGTVSTEAKAALAREAGADDIILYSREDFVTETKRLTNGEGVHVVFDSVGRTTFLRGLDCLMRRGMMVLYGQSSGSVEPVDPQLLNRKGSLFLTRPTLVHYTATQSELAQRAAEVFAWADAGTLSVRIEREYPLADAADAHRALEARQTTGKLLLIP